MVQTVHAFAEKVALISDAASPAGRAAVMQLALQGAYVIGLFPNGGKGNLDELVELGTLAFAFDIDASTPDGAQAAAAEVARTFGRLDLLVNCLKFAPKSSFEDVTEADFVRAVACSLGSVFFLTRAVTDLMTPRPKPKIVNVTTAGSRNALYSSTQAAVVDLTASLSVDLPAHFRVNCVAVKEDSGQPSAGADDVARAIMFLLSSESIGMNGQTINLG